MVDRGWVQSMQNADHFCNDFVRSLCYNHSINRRTAGGCRAKGDHPMPITLEQLKLKQRQNPEQFKKDQQAMFAFSKLLWTRGNELMKEPKSNYPELFTQVRN